MKILAIDTSAIVASCALCEDRVPVAVYSQKAGLNHSQTMLPMVKNLMDNTNVSIDDIDMLAVSAGPGSFTGIRIGVATIKGLAFGKDKICVGVSTLEAMANADIEKVEGFVHSCGFYRQKAKDIVLACQMLLEKHDGKVPDSMDDLLKLPGVGRKTANLLLGDLYAQPGSVVCDTHCIRICGRLGFTDSKDPEKVERQLRAILPPEESSDFCHRIVLFGRDTCIARSPKCEGCPLAVHCKYITGQ